MKKFWICYMLLWVLAACTTYQWTDVTLPNQFVIHTRLADTPEKAEKGLMFVKHLPDDEGMLFVFDKTEPHYFWMKNTLIDLDIIFIAADGTINEIYSHVPHTYTYTPQHEIPIVEGTGKYVLEVLAGTAERQHLQPGDKLIFALP